MQQRVRGRGVAVDGDAVEGRVVGARRPSPAAARGATAASVKRKTSIVAMSGAIMPEPLAKPVIVTGTPSSSTRATAPLGKVSVVMIARAARSAASAARPSRERRPAPRRCARPAAARRSPRSRRRRHGPPGCRAPRAVAATVASTAARPAPPVKALALPELTRIAKPPSPPPALQRRELLLAPEHRRRARRRAGEDPGDRRARRDLGQHHVEPALVAHPGLGGGEAHAGDRPAAPGSRRRRERRDRRACAATVASAASVGQQVALADRRRRQCRSRAARSWPRRAARRAWPAAPPGAAGSRSRGRTCVERRRRCVSRFSFELDQVPAELGLDRPGDVADLHRRSPPPRTPAPSGRARTSRGRRRSRPSRRLEFAFATSAKSAPPSISAFSAFALSSLVDQDVRGVELRLRLEARRSARRRRPATLASSTASATAALGGDARPARRAARSRRCSLHLQRVGLRRRPTAPRRAAPGRPAGRRSPVISTSSGRFWYCSRQPVAQRDHVAEGDLGAVDGGEHGRGVVGACPRRPAPAAGRARMPARRPAVRRLRMSISRSRAAVAARREIPLGTRSGAPLTGAAQPLTSLAGRSRAARASRMLRPFGAGEQAPPS